MSGPPPPPPPPPAKAAAKAPKLSLAEQLAAKKLQHTQPPPESQPAPAAEGTTGVSATTSVPAAPHAAPKGGGNMMSELQNKLKKRFNAEGGPSAESQPPPVVHPVVHAPPSHAPPAPPPVVHAPPSHAPPAPPPPVHPSGNESSLPVYAPPPAAVPPPVYAPPPAAVPPPSKIPLASIPPPLVVKPAPPPVAPRDDISVKPIPATAVPLKPALYNGKINIFDAKYGYGSQFFDVTNQLQKMILEKDPSGLFLSEFTYLLMKHSNAYNNAFGDPAFGKDKDLTFSYQVVGKLKEKVFTDDQLVRLVPIPDNFSGHISSHSHVKELLLYITDATYGVPGSTIDVLNILQNIATQQGGKKLEAFGSTVGYGPGAMQKLFGDPAPGKSKTLKIQYRFSTPINNLTFPENEQIILDYRNLADFL